MTHDSDRRGRAAVRKVADSVVRLLPTQQLRVTSGVVATATAAQVTVTVNGMAVPMVYLGAQPNPGDAVKVLLVDSSPICLGVWSGIPIT